MPYTGLDKLKTKLMGDEPNDGLLNRTSQTNGACMAAEGKGMDVATMRMELAFLDKEKKDKKKKKK